AGRRARVVITPPGAGNTWDLGTPDSLSITINGAAPVVVAVPAADADATTAAEIAAAINASAAGVRAVVTDPRTVTVTGPERVGDVPTLAIAATPTAAALTAVATDGLPGTAPDSIGGMRLSLSEKITATAPAVLF